MYKLLIGTVVPRPIAWVSCRSASGVANVAPFSYFNVVASRPPMLGFSVSLPTVAGKAQKDTVAAIWQTREFVVNLAEASQLDQLVLTSIEYPADVDEFDRAGLVPVAGEHVAAPRIAAAPVSFECRLHQMVPLGQSYLIIGRVVAVHAQDGLVHDNFAVDLYAYRPLGRMAGPRFCTELNAVTRAVKQADPSRSDSELLWLRD